MFIVGGTSCSPAQAACDHLGPDVRGWLPGPQSRRRRGRPLRHVFHDQGNGSAPRGDGAAVRDQPHAGRDDRVPAERLRRHRDRGPGRDPGGLSAGPAARQRPPRGHRAVHAQYPAVQGGGERRAAVRRPDADQHHRVPPQAAGQEEPRGPRACHPHGHDRTPGLQRRRLALLLQRARRHPGRRGRGAGRPRPGRAAPGPDHHRLHGHQRALQVLHRPRPGSLLSG
jgi:hypothetical protein